MALPATESGHVARSVVKWAGGKRALLPELVPLVPAQIKRYYEPFAGGAALFFALASERPRRFERATLADTNEDLIALYRALQRAPEALMQQLAGYRYDESMYYAVRDQDPRTLSEIERGARLLFLNKTCFNGLWRVNASGQFNVPFGRFFNPKILDVPRLTAAAAALKQVSVLHADFAKVTARARAGDFVYFDPPYFPVSATANFTAYGSAKFDLAEQQRLAGELRRLRARGVQAMLSNADTPQARELYKDFAMRVVYTRRAINSSSDKRGPAPELVVCNWGPPGIERRDERRCAGSCAG